MNLKNIIALVILCAFVNISFAECTVAHTHIGVNPTWRPDWSDPGNASLATDSDPTDDNKLWFFSIPPVHPVCPTPGWPNWEQVNGDVFLILTPVLDGGSPVNKPGDPSKQLWNCYFQYSQSRGYGDPAGHEHINGWHSAHGPQGKWNLASDDPCTVPAWDIYLRREGTSVASDDFFLLFEDDSLVPLTEDGDIYQLSKQWLSDKNAWGIHEHMVFHFWLEPDFNDTVSVTFSAYDLGGMYDPGYFTIHFAREVCVPVEGDINNDCEVNLLDLAKIAENWLQDGWYGS